MSKRTVLASSGGNHPAIWRQFVTAILVASVLLVLIFAQTTAQDSPGVWTSPSMIPGSEGAVSWSTLVGDSHGNLHVLFAQGVGEGLSPSIDYTVWDGASWAQPVDIIAESAISFPHAVLASDEVAHLIWIGPQNQLRYASAPIAQAGSARAWTAPRTLGIASGESGIALGEDGALYIAYSDRATLDAVMLTKSTDSGVTWSEPILVAQASQQDVVPDGVQVAVDGAGRVHVTWAEWELPSGTRSIGTFYARSVDGGETWAAPRQMAVGHYGQIGVGTSGNDQVHLVWRSGIGGDGTFHQWSADGGETWAPPDRFDDRGGFSGLPSFVEDATGNLHFVLGSVKYANWNGQQLSPYQDVAAERRALQTTSVERGAIGITSGNQLHIVFEFDFQSLWHTSKLLDIPPLPTPTPGNASILETPVSPEPTPMAALTATPEPGAGQGTSLSQPVGQEQRSESSVLGPLAFGILPAFLLVALVVVNQLTRGRRK